MNEKLALLDWFVLVLYAAAVLYIGFRAGRTENDTEDYFLGGRKMPWWAVMISIYATALSALTFIGVPGAAYTSDFHYLQLGFGDLIGRCLIAGLLLTAYYRGRVTSVYELLGARFGPRTHDAGTLFFIATRLLASAVRLTGCAIAFSVVFRVSLTMAIWLIAVIALGYTMVGGIKAVIWTDFLQFILFISAACISIVTIILSLPNGWDDFIAIGQAHEKFKIFHLSTAPAAADYWLNFNNPEALVAGMLFGCISTFAALGTDQDLVQRMLTCERVKESQRALICTALLNFPVTLIFLTVGAALFTFYNVYPDPLVTAYLENKEADKIFPHFIKTILDPGLRGLVIAGMLAAGMSAVDSASNALASSAYVDIYQRYFGKSVDNRTAVRVSRALTAIFVCLLAILAMVFGQTDSILWLGFRIVGYTYGAMLGIFLLAVLTRTRGHDLANPLIMLSSVVLVIVMTSNSLGPLEPMRMTILRFFSLDRPIAWPWAIAIGAAWTLGLGLLVSQKPLGQRECHSIKP